MMLCFISATVLEPPSIPETINIIEYDDVVLLCDSSGSIPVISHTWSIEGGNVVSSNAELVLLNISRTQDGVYTCTIENDIGETESAMTTINVLSMYHSLWCILHTLVMILFSII